MVGLTIHHSFVLNKWEKKTTRLIYVFLKQKSPKIINLYFFIKTFKCNLNLNINELHFKVLKIKHKLFLNIVKN